MSQCEYIRTDGQCPNDAEPSSRFCRDHGRKTTKNVINSYHIANQFAGNAALRHSQATQVKSLYGEIAILRAMLENRFNAIDSQAEMESAAPSIRDMAVAIEKLVNSTTALDIKMSAVVDKGTLIRIAQKMIEATDQEVRALRLAAGPESEDGERVMQIPDQEVSEMLERLANSFGKTIADEDNDAK
jgi:hypothetical protein